ncbi:hypothetical protein [Mesorhizobium cantuariense]|uniref:Uncharacterized protein n=1 Tax=Mesorhizobium cantuariense TaxID=1300275 RepID=A0ABV7MXN5_9HYPH
MAVPIYSVGTATLTAGSAAMVGQGTLWLGNVRPYDMVIGNDGKINLVLTVNSNTSITLLFNWGGTTQTAQPYRILYTADDPFTQTLVRQVMQTLAASALIALGGLTPTPRQGVYFDQTSAAALFSLTDAGRALLDDADAPAQLTTLGFSAYFKTLVAAASSSALQPLLGVREVPTTSRTYFVRPDGNDAINNGLTNTAGGAFQTLQKAWNTLAGLDLAAQAGFIVVADGTYAPLNMTTMPIGGTGITITGNTTTPANCHISTTGTCIQINAPLPCPMTITGFKMTFAGASQSAIKINAPGTVTCSNINLAGGSTGFSGAYYAGERGSRIIIIALGQVVSGSMSCFCQTNGGVIQFAGNFAAAPIVLTGTPAWSWVGVLANSGGVLEANGVVFSGTATGQRYAAQAGGGINTSGGGASYFPGNVAGTVSSGGWYA